MKRSIGLHNVSESRKFKMWLASPGELPRESSRNLISGCLELFHFRICPKQDIRAETTRPQRKQSTSGSRMNTGSNAWTSAFIAGRSETGNYLSRITASLGTISANG